MAVESADQIGLSVQGDDAVELSEAEAPGAPSIRRSLKKDEGGFAGGIDRATDHSDCLGDRQVHASGERALENLSELQPVFRREGAVIFHGPGIDSPGEYDRVSPVDKLGIGRY